MAKLPNKGLKAITMICLIRPSFPTNLNAGEGGSNITDLKMYEQETKPYTSPQAFRHALREGIKRLYPEAFMCDTVAACGDVKNCWLCDLLGYFNASLPRRGRTSPLHGSGLWGQVRTEVITDLILRAPGEGNNTVHPALAHIQLTDNIYRAGLGIDIKNIGLMSTVSYEKPSKSKGNDEKDNGDEGGKSNKGGSKMPLFDGFDHRTISVEERRERTIAVLQSMMLLQDFAKRARGFATLYPRVLIAGVHPVYDNGLAEALQLDANGNVDIEELRETLTDVTEIEGTKLFFGYHKNIITNGDDVVALMTEFGVEKKGVRRAFKDLTEEVESAEIDMWPGAQPFE